AYQLSLQRLIARIGRSVAGDYAESIFPVGQSVGIQREVVVLEIGNEHMPFGVALVAIVDTIAERVSIAVFGLPLERSGALLKDFARLHVGRKPESGWIESRRNYSRIDGLLRYLLQSHTGRQYRNLRHFRSHVAKQIGKLYRPERSARLQAR